MSNEKKDVQPLKPSTSSCKISTKWIRTDEFFPKQASQLQLIVAHISNIENKILTYEETENLNKNVIVEPQCNQKQNKIQSLVQKDSNSRNVTNKHAINFNETDKQLVNQNQENQTISKPKLKKIKPLKLKKQFFRQLKYYKNLRSGIN